MPLPAKGPRSWGRYRHSPPRPHQHLYTYVYNIYTKQRQNPFLPSLAPHSVMSGTLQGCRRGQGGRVSRTGPHQHPQALTRGHPISLPPPSLSPFPVSLAKTE